MNRRDFFKTLAAAAAATWLDVMDPGAVHPIVNFDEINKITLQAYSSYIEDQFFLKSPLLLSLRDQGRFESHG